VSGNFHVLFASAFKSAVGDADTSLTRIMPNHSAFRERNFVTAAQRGEGLGARLAAGLFGVFVIAELANAPFGWEDELGFHFGAW
jgi:hypothetical protein